MKKLFLAKAFVLLSLICFAQSKPAVSYDFKVETSAPYPVVDGSKYYFSKGDNMYALKREGDVIHFQKYLVKGGLKQLKHEEVKDMPDSYTIDDVREFGGTYYLFYSVYDKANTTEQLFKREIDFDGLKFAGKAERIIAVNGKLTGSPFAEISNGYGFGFGVGTINKFDILTSFDKSKIIIQYRKKPETRNDAKSFDVIGMVVFDNKMEKLWEKEVKMPYTEKKMNNLDYAIDSEGNGYILALVYNDDSDRKFVKGVINYHIELIKVEAKTGDIEKTPIEIAGKSINSIALYENGQNYMTCAGFYAKTKNAANADGVFVFKLDKKGGVRDAVYHEIPVSVLNQYVSKRQAAKNEKKEEAEDEDGGGGVDFKNLVMRDLNFMADGSIVITAEQYYVVERRDSQTGRVTYTYYYNDMLITKINPNGEIAWMQKLGKRQRGGAGKGAMSFEYIYANGNHYLYYLDNVNNLELGTDEVPKFHQDGKGGFLTAYKLDDKEGHVSKVSILDMRGVKSNPNDKEGIEIFQFTPSKVVKVTDKEFVFESYIKKKQDILIKMTLEN